MLQRITIILINVKNPAPWGMRAYMARVSLKSELEGMFRHTSLAGSVSVSDSGSGGQMQINIKGLDKPCAFVDQATRTVFTYRTRFFKAKLRQLYPDKAGELIGKYQEVLNVLRRHKYSLSLFLAHSPQ